MILLSTEPRPRDASGILKRSAKKFYAAALEGGWSIHMTDRDGRLTIEARDLMTCLAPDEADPFGDTVRVIGYFDDDTGAFTGYDTWRLSRHWDSGQPRYVDQDWKGYGSDKKTVTDLCNILSNGPTFREARAQKIAQAKADEAARKLRHDAMLNATRVAGDTPLGTKVREQLTTLVAAKTDRPDISKVYGHRYEEAIEDWYKRNELADLAREAQKCYMTIVGEFPNEKVLTPELAVAYHAEKVVGLLVSDNYPSKGENEARREFIHRFHPIYGRNHEMSNVEVIRDDN